MTTDLLTEKYADQIDGVLACYDRLILTGSLFPFSYAQGMSGYVSSTILSLRKTCESNFAAMRKC